MSRPLLLDLFCGAGGCSMGYHRAGFDVVGVDIKPQPNYPFTFFYGDATTWPLKGFDAIHASPPCQDHMQTPHKKHGTGWMLNHTRQRLEDNGIPWILENVPGADMRPDFRICGCHVGLELRRERIFETSWMPWPATMPRHRHNGPVLSVVGHGTPTWVRDIWVKKYGRNPSIADYRKAMGIDWMNRGELSQAIPPAYTEYVGKRLLAAITEPRS